MFNPTIWPTTFDGRVTSPTHDATALAAALALFGSAGDSRALLVATGCIAVQGVAGWWATVAQRREEASLRARGAKGIHARWRGPRKSLTRPLRLAAVGGAAMVAWPAAIALACARLPDQLEVGRIDHRKMTHYLVTAAVVIVGAWIAVARLAPESAVLVAQAVACGLLMHLVMDMCTRSGVPLFGPVWRGDVHLLPVGWRPRTGGLVDLLVMAGSLGAVALAVST